MLKFISIISAALISVNISAAEFKTTTELKPFSESVMKKISENDLQAAFALMQPYVVIPSAEFQSVALNSKAQRDQYGARYGKSFGFEFISQQNVGESLVSFVYIEKTEKHALPWTFYYYKTPKGWVLNSFNWNDKLVTLFSNK
jgi:hypothetical protein